MPLLVQFLLRLCFGLAAAMLLVSPRLVTSGYFRNNLYVTLGMAALAALLSRLSAPGAFWYAVLAAAGSYLGSVCWLYEKSGAGRAALLITALAGLTGCIISWSSCHPFADRRGAALVDRYFPERTVEQLAEPGYVEREEASLKRAGNWSAGLGLASLVSSGLLLGTAMAAMLLGHWYLNSPTMELAPLRRLILSLAAATLVQSIVSGLGLWGEIELARTVSTPWLLFVLLRWSFGLAGVGILAWMAWQTLKIPNTQSATGILYVAVIGVFVGETVALLLSAESLFPV